jgi:hypothetical protein
LMTFLKIIFVIMVCMPVAYILLRLTVNLIDQFSSTARKSGAVRRDAGRTGAAGGNSGSARKRRKKRYRRVGSSQNRGGAGTAGSGRNAGTTGSRTGAGERASGKYTPKKYSKRSGSYKRQYSAPKGSGYRGYDNGGGRGGK